MTKLDEIKKELFTLANKAQAAHLNRFFKTGPGQYGEGDVFLGIKVPVQRQVAAKYKDLELDEIEELLHEKFHEMRLTAIIILVNQFKKADKELRSKIVRLYLKNTKWINNWDLVDLSAHYIIGAYLLDKPRDVLYKLATSKMLWERRIAIISTFAFIRNGEYADTKKLSEILAGDKHDLMHKACGWMLREMGKRDEGELIAFLDKNALKLPRTSLRYAIERLEEGKRRYYLGLGKK